MNIKMGNDSRMKNSEFVDEFSDVFKDEEKEFNQVIDSSIATNPSFGHLFMGRKKGLIDEEVIFIKHKDLLIDACFS